MKRTLFLLSAFTIAGFTVFSQNVGSSPEYIKTITSEWKGERFADGRPKVPDEFLEFVKNYQGTGNANINFF
jgi:4-hydroxy-4-methyl-2-oxoglutarate aldolase